MKFWRGSEDNPEAQVTVTLEDDGPDVMHYPSHGADLCVKPAQVFAPHIPLEKMATAFALRLSYRIIGAAKYVPRCLTNEATMRS